MFEGRPVVDNQDQDVFNLQQTDVLDRPAFVNVDNLHDNSKISNTVPVPRFYSLHTRTRTRSNPSAADRQYYHRKSYVPKR